MNKMQSMIVPGASNFRFSGVRPEALGASEYTLATIVVDTTGSVSGFADELRKAVKSIIDSLRKSPFPENLLVRLVTFNEEVEEVFGFKALADIDSTLVDGAIDPAGLTALYDASLEALGATEQYAQVLYDQDFDVNAAVYVITDGDDNRSRSATAAAVASRVAAVRQSERLASIITMLIGINTTDPRIAQSLADYGKEGQFDQYVDVGEASAGRLAKLAGFVSKSISSQSVSLMTGSPSQSLSF